MSDMPDKRTQIVDAHSGLIHRVVIACQNKEAVPDLDQILRTAEENGWTELVAAVRQILGGSRDATILNALDEEDGVIIDAILRGIQDPSTLPDPLADADPTVAAPGLASLIHAARTGDMRALDTIANMATHMSQAGGQMGRLAALMRPLSLGERDPNRLCENLEPETEKLVMSILQELKALEGPSH